MVLTAHTLGEETEESVSPNVVFILTDDQGYPELGCHGNSCIQTPHIDALYEESARFDQFHVGPTCAPTRAGIMTGHHANSTGVWHTIGGRSLLRENEWTLPSALKAAGYCSGLFGKWHLGDQAPYRPQDRGFDETVCHGGGGISQSLDWWGNDYIDDTYMVNGEPQAFEGYCTDVFFEQGLQFIEAHRNEPFFCMIAPNAPHEPFNVPNAYRARYQDSDEPDTYQRFMAMVSNIDDNVGHLRKRLHDWGLAENTILIFMSDNGTAGEAWAGRDNPYRAGMRGEKGSEYEGGHRVPFFLHWPRGGYHRAMDIEVLTSYVDFMPTLLELCQVSVPAERSFHGASLVSLLKGEQDDHWEERVLVTDSQRVTSPIKWKQSAVMKSQWRLINGSELFDLSLDPAQQNDVANEQPERVEELSAAYENWWALVSQQFDEAIPFHLGDEEVCLNTHDWRNDDSAVAWHQGHIRAGKLCNGYWEVHVDSAGEYDFEIRRWPRESGHRIRSGIEGDDISWCKEACWPAWHGVYSGGQSLPIQMAELIVSGVAHQHQPVEASDSYVKFRVSLQAGPAHVQTRLTNEEDLELGAYYVYVKKNK